MKYLMLLGLGLFSPFCLWGGIHTAPIIIPAKTVRPIEYHQISLYRVFQTDKNGNAIPIPFQIDERDRFNDFVLDQGPLPNRQFGNGLFDGEDELSFMGDDVGPVQVPTKWSMAKPSLLYELRLELGGKKGAVYVGVYERNPPPLSPKHYVDYHISESEIRTANYQYFFNPKNYLVVRGISIIDHEKKTAPLILTSTFYLKVDLKYFLTFQINQEDVQSSLEAYKIGPVRVLARVIFSYKFLKINFDLGMYTEVSFFSNSIILPAVIDNPFSGKKTLNEGSLFYYGFSSVKNPKDLQLTSNMPLYTGGSIWDLFSAHGPAVSSYWVTALDPAFMIFMEIGLSPEMVKSKTLPMLYVEKEPGSEVNHRSHQAQPLGKSPVNVAIALDMSTLDAGSHVVAFQLFVDNTPSATTLDTFKDLKSWQVFSRRLLPKQW